MLSRNAVGRNAPATSSTPIFVGQRVIGYVQGDTFRKTITGSKHLLRSPRAICFDRCTLRDAAAAGAMYARIIDRETGTSYQTTFATIEAHSFAVKRGHGDQIGVILDHWSINDATPVAEQRVAQGNREREDVQLSLFSEVP